MTALQPMQEADSRATITLPTVDSPAARHWCGRARCELHAHSRLESSGGLDVLADGTFIAAKTRRIPPYERRGGRSERRRRSRLSQTRPATHGLPNSARDSAQRQLHGREDRSLRHRGRDRPPTDRLRIRNPRSRRRSPETTRTRPHPGPKTHGSPPRPSPDSPGRPSAPPCSANLTAPAANTTSRALPALVDVPDSSPEVGFRFSPEGRVPGVLMHPGSVGGSALPLAGLATVPSTCSRRPSRGRGRPFGHSPRAALGRPGLPMNRMSTFGFVVCGRGTHRLAPSSTERLQMGIVRSSRVMQV